MFPANPLLIGWEINQVRTRKFVRMKYEEDKARYFTRKQGLAKPIAV